ncbi:MAG TPA: MBL fold metallo-hydrolase [Acidimicrobiia bacterium]|nr:MBL fold metallo-hydrolase [Acidimicrobiia bacterium]
MKIHVCGSRGSTPTPGRDFCRYGGHTSSIAISRDDRPDLLLDAGTGIRRVTRLLGDRPFEGSILLGHLHWDHTHGLPFFAAGDRPDARVDLYIPEQDGTVEDTLATFMAPPHFPIGPTDLHGNWRFLHLPEGTHRIEGYEVTAREVPHKGGRTFGYRISDGHVTVAYLSDHHPTSFGAGPEGYGPYHEAAVTLAREADLLIHDAQYLDDEWPTRSHFGHSTPGYAIGLAREAGARRLMMFHHDPARTDDDLDILATQWSKTEELNVITAMEGETIDVTVGG